MAITAIDEQTGQRQTLFGAHHMGDALPWIIQIIEVDPMVTGVLAQCLDHAHYLWITGLRTASRWRIMVNESKGQIRLANR